MNLTKHVLTESPTEVLIYSVDNCSGISVFMNISAKVIAKVKVDASSRLQCKGAQALAELKLGMFNFTFKVANITATTGIVYAFLNLLI